MKVPLLSPLCVPFVQEWGTTLYAPILVVVDCGFPVEPFVVAACGSVIMAPLLTLVVIIAYLWAASETGGPQI